MDAASGYAQIPGWVMHHRRVDTEPGRGLDVTTWTAVILENTEKQGKRLHTGFSTCVDNLSTSNKSYNYIHIPT
jgi:hypothetical protein